MYSTGGKAQRGFNCEAATVYDGHFGILLQQIIF